MSDTKPTEGTTSKSPTHIAYQVRDRDGQKGLLDANRKRMATRRRQGIQHPARLCAARRPDHPPRRH